MGAETLSLSAVGTPFLICLPRMSEGVNEWLEGDGRALCSERSGLVEEDHLWRLRVEQFIKVVTGCESGEFIKVVKSCCESQRAGH